MTTRTIDIPLSASLETLLKTPVCIPLPKPGKVEITLPWGGATLKAFNDISKGIPDDCSLSFSLALQIAPLLANMKCLIEALSVVGPLIETIQALATLNPIEIGKALEKLLPAVKPLLDCVAKFFIGVPIFLRDLLALIAKMLRCIVSQLRSILNVMSGLSLQITSAKSSGNTELLATLQCAQENAQASAEHAMSAIEPIMVLLALAEPLFGLASINPIKTPQIGSDSSLQGLQSIIDTIDGIAKTLQLAAEALGAPHAA